MAARLTSYNVSRSRVNVFSDWLGLVSIIKTNQSENRFIQAPPTKTKSISSGRVQPPRTSTSLFTNKASNIIILTIIKYLRSSQVGMNARL